MPIVVGQWAAQRALWAAPPPLGRAGRSALPTCALGWSAGGVETSAVAPPRRGIPASSGCNARPAGCSALPPARDAGEEAAAKLRLAGAAADLSAHATSAGGRDPPGGYVSGHFAAGPQTGHPIEEEHCALGCGGSLSACGQELAKGMTRSVARKTGGLTGIKLWRSTAAGCIR